MVWLSDIHLQRHFHAKPEKSMKRMSDKTFGEAYQMDMDRLFHRSPASQDLPFRKRN
jgi:hypothetical protein